MNPHHHYMSKEDRNFCLYWKMDLFQKRGTEEADPNDLVPSQTG